MKGRNVMDEIKVKTGSRIYAMEAINLGREVFRQSFMAVDYLEMKVLNMIKKDTRREMPFECESDSKREEGVKKVRVGAKPVGKDITKNDQGFGFRQHRSTEASPRSVRSMSCDQKAVNLRSLKSESAQPGSSPRIISFREYVRSDQGDVPGWVLVVLMTTGLVTAIWAVAAPKLNAILKNSLDSMNNIR